MTDDIKCPICDSKTILRTVIKGPDTGKSFHVCNRYPECKGRIEDLDDILEPVVKRGLRWGPIFLGAFFCSVLIASATSIILDYFPDMSVTALIFTVVGIVLVCYLIGGLIAGAMAGYAGVAHGWRVGLIACVVSIIGNFITGTYSGGSLGLIFALLILVGFGALGGALGARLRNR